MISRELAGAFSFLGGSTGRGRKKIGEGGLNERAIINVAKFATRLAEKKK